MMTKRRGLGLLALAVAAGLFGGWRMLGISDAAHAADPPAPREVPVGADAARIQDVPVNLEGLGTVQALNIVQVTAQVTGTLIALPVREGQEVHKDDILAEIDPRPYQATLDQTVAQRDEDAALLQSARLDLRRYQDLAKRQFAPVQQVDDQQATVNKDAAAVALDNAKIETAQINLGYCVMRAPFDGRVSFYQINIGNVIQIGGSNGIVSVTQDKPISVVFTLPEADLIRIQQARANGPVPVVVFSNDGKRQLAAGTLLTPNNQIDTTTGTISLKATFANDDDHLWPGEFVNARVQVGTMPKAVTVSTLAVQHGPDGLFVYVVKPDGTVAQANVQASIAEAGRTVITKGITGSETVVVSGQSRLAPGAHVKVMPPAAAQSADSDDVPSAQPANAASPG